MTAPQEQKLRISGPVVVTGNRLADGAVVYRTKQGSWSTELDTAAVTHAADEAGRWLALGLADGLNAVGIYVAPVLLDAAGRVAPGNLRESIRRGGPTIMSALSVQG